MNEIEARNFVVPFNNNSILYTGSDGNTYCNVTRLTDRFFNHVDNTSPEILWKQVETGIKITMGACAIVLLLRALRE